MASAERTIIGWREWVTLPQLDVDAIKAKIDTGARTSALHAFNLSHFRKQNADWVRFDIHPLQRNTQLTIHAKCPLIAVRKVRSSNGQVTERPVILTEVQILNHRIPIELTLVNRDAMGFRMLLGRTAIRRRFAVDPSRSFLTGSRKS